MTATATKSKKKPTVTPEYYKKVREHFASLPVPDGFVRVQTKWGRPLMSVEDAAAWVEQERADAQAARDEEDAARATGRPYLWMDPIPGVLREQARAALDAGDVEGFLITASNAAGLALVDMNARQMLDRGVFERGLVVALTGCNLNNHGWSMSALTRLVARADRGRMLAAGSPLPGPGPFTLYRGVAGRTTRDRRVRGLSWTTSKITATWFAQRFAGGCDPTVYSIDAPAEWVLTYALDRNEDEMLVIVPRHVTPTVVLDGAALLAQVPESQRLHAERAASAGVT